MAADTFTEVTGKSWFGRIGEAIKGIVFGVILVIAAFVLIFWNEGRTVKRYRTLKEGAGLVVSVAADSVSPQNEGKLVHLSGLLTSDEILADRIFGVSATGLRLLRTAKMYQWKEKKEKKTRKKLGGGTETVTTYHYIRIWSERHIDSSSFRKPEGHENPSGMDYSSTEEVTGTAHLGVFGVPASFAGRFGQPRALPVKALPQQFMASAKLESGTIYLGTDPASPAVGDMRISFSLVSPGTASIIARQTGQGVSSYQAEAGGTIELIEEGAKSAAEMFAQAQSENKMLAWILRLVAFVMMAFGFGLILKPLSVLADVVPLIGSLVGAGTGLIAIVLGFALSMLAIAVAWITVRPLLAAGLLAAALVPVLWARTRIK